jgi:hypothetical protein
MTLFIAFYFLHATCIKKTKSSSIKDQIKDAIKVNNNDNDDPNSKKKKVN